MSSHRRFTKLDCALEHPPCLFVSTRDALITSADNQVDFFHTAKGDYFEVVQVDSLDTILMTKDAQGWVLFQHAGDADGYEFTQGVQATTTKQKFVVGTDAFHLKVTFDIPGVADYDVAAVGFRKLAAYADVTTAASLITAYEDVAYLNCNAGDIFTATRLAAGVGTATDTTSNWLDGAEHTLEVYCSAAGVCTFKVDGTSVGSSFTLTSAITVIPSIIFVATEAITSGEEPILVSYECGIQ